MACEVLIVLHQCSVIFYKESMQNTTVGLNAESQIRIEPLTERELRSKIQTVLEIRFAVLITEKGT